MKKVFTTAIGLLLVTYLFGQDRVPGINVVYPASVLDGDQVIDITQPPFNAVGDGVTNNTAAFVAAYDTVINRIKTLCPSLSRSNCKELDIRITFYVPDGTYLVSNTLIYSGPLFTTNNPNLDRLQHIRFIGQSREKTIIKLQDNAPGYQAGADKPVVAFSKGTFNNTANSTTLRNLTVNTGSGNPGAIGVSMAGANNCSSYNLKIVSEDGSGSVGLDFSVGAVIGYHRDILIEGFDYGMRLVPYHFTSPTIEHITIRNQNVAGVLFVDGIGTLRKLKSENMVPAIQCTSPGNHAVILDSEFSGGSSSNAAIDLQQGHVFARNITTSGYGSSISKAGAVVVADPYVQEYVSDEIIQWSASSPTVSMNLPIEDSPEYWSSDLNDWADVDDYPSVQEAFDSGKPIIVFSKRRYSFDNTINVPTSVRRVVGLYTSISTKANGFIVSEDSDTPVIFDDLGVRGGTAMVQACPRTIVLNNVGSQNNLYRSETSSGKLFINACNGLKYGGPLKNIDAFVRFMNTESTNTQFLVDNSNVVVMGYKTEKLYTSFEAINGSRLEILGGLPNQYATTKGDPLNPIIEINNSEASIVLATNGPDEDNVGYENIIRDTQGDITKTWTKADFPAREGRPSDAVVPLYVNHNGPYVDGLPPTTFCLAPDLLSAVPGPADVQLSWNIRNEAVNGNEVRYRKQGTEEWLTIIGITDTTITITELASVTSYEWQVRVKCGEDFSAWSPIGEFSTSLGAKSIATPLSIDGTLDEPTWEINVAASREARGNNDNTVTFGLLWDETYLYVGANVLDAALFNDSEQTINDDGIAIYLKANNGAENETTVNRIIQGYDDDSLSISGPFEGTILHDWSAIEGGYSVELAIPWSGLQVSPTAGFTLDFNLGCNDDDNGGNRDGQLVWVIESNRPNALAYGDLILIGAAPVAPPTDTLAGIYKLLARHSGKALSVDLNEETNGGYSDATADGVNVFQFGTDDDENRLWDIQPVDGEYYKLISVYSGKALAVDLNQATNGGFSNAKANGVNVFQFGTNDNNNRLWKIEQTESGDYTLTNKRSGKVLEVFQADTTDGTNVQQWTRGQQANKQWQLVPVDTTAPAPSVPLGQTVWLRSLNTNYYVTANLGQPNAPLQASWATTVDTWEEFVVEDAGNGLIALKAAANGRYVAAEATTVNNPLRANRTAVDAWEQFTWIANADGTISLLADATGKYVSTESSGELRANRTAADTWEKYTWGIVGNARTMSQGSKSVVEPLVNEGFVSYPNPVRDVLRLKGVSRVSEVRILSLEGRQMLYQKLDRKGEVNTEHLPTGLYILEVQQAGKSPWRTKIVKQ